MAEYVYIPPVKLENYDDFVNYVPQAKIVTFDVAPFESPTGGDPKIKSVTLYAVGVPVHEVPITFIYQRSWEDLQHDASDWGDVVEMTHQNLMNFVVTFKNEFNALPGRPVEPMMSDDIQTATIS